MKENEQKTLYHGSKHKLNPGDYLSLSKSENYSENPSEGNKPTKAIFATSKIDYALKYAFDLHQGWNLDATDLWRDNKKIFVFFSKKPKFYIYKVEPNGFKTVFENYNKDEYAAFNDVKIIERIPIVPETFKEIMKDSVEVKMAKTKLLKPLFNIANMKIRRLNNQKYSRLMNLLTIDL